MNEIRKTILYTAVSLDGFIADKNGGIEWLEKQDIGPEGQESYENFIQTVDTVVMGYTTYHQITTELSAGFWPDEGKMTYVMTHRAMEDKENIKFVNSPLDQFISALKDRPGKDIWICGGADLVNQLIKSGLISRFHISVIPVILGNGIRLFHEGNPANQLKLISADNLHGMTDLVYETCE